MSQNRRKPPSTDIFHFSLLAALLALAWLLNWAFGFESGTVRFGTIFSIAVFVWAAIALIDYFR